MDTNNKKVNTELLNEILSNGEGDVSDVVRIYDQLEPVSLGFMTGRWKGYEIKTGHSLDGMLVPSGWYGKVFKSPEEVHPLVFFAKNKTQLYAVNPKKLSMDVKVPSKIIGVLMSLAKPFLQTKKSGARLRMIEYRGKATATMQYDDKPINDHFIKINENTVLGLMDKKGDSPNFPYAFVLERDNESNYQIKF
ncbi:DUF4334 domain-containing protein [Cellulophaga baltica]|uniref:DUF4334 domain-containing protein n=1 Tax=Cellulophaga TaxID=104264 RepID=UPI001C064F42|nr:MULTISPECIES: DUF4334 domain-containing protein [Cellulophaga]MBU2996438.1 DUF4334 domain-containing protein [Cellulophaga baltica]MDO6767833.1 DUF4334 domain-containing protein [Cellulophaga sp. 1_MG-2023]